MKKMVISTLAVVISLFVAHQAMAHCEIPCGIYGDTMRFEQIAEHITTLEKSMKMITKLSLKKNIDYNQLVRWVTNKEKHAEEIQHIVAQYFVAQRVKLVRDKKSEKYKKYVTQLILLHKLTVYSMKAKQSTDLEVIEKLRLTLKKFKTAYTGVVSK